MNKKCSHCNIVKPLDQFPIGSGNRGSTGKCKECKNAIKRNINLINSQKRKVINLDGEVWKDVVGYEGFYMVSNFGRIKSLYRQYKRKSVLVTTFERLMKLGINDYYIFKTASTGVLKTITVHRAIAQCFIPNPDNKPCVNHIDGNKLNNSIENLEWVTFKENTIHGVENGLIKICGESNHFAKLVESQVIEIYTSKETTRELAKRYSVNDETIRKIRVGINWKQITKNINK